MANHRMITAQVDKAEPAERQEEEGDKLKESTIMSRSFTTQSLLEQLRLDIIMCKYEDGTQIRELELAAKYGVSRAAVRNALMVLEQEGMVIALSNGTKRLRRLTVADIYDLYDLRNYIENRAIEQIFDKADCNFAHLLEIWNNINTGTRKGATVEEILALDAAFHRESIALSGNQAITQAWDMMDGVTEAVFRLNMTESPEYKEWFLNTVVSRHWELLSVLMTDREKSKKLFSGHIQDALKVSVKAMERIHGE